MKKALVFVSLLAITLSAFSQKSYNVMGWKVSKEKNYLQNELKINLPISIFASYPEISYERILSPDMSVGASLGVGLQKGYYPVNMSFIPHFRWFFGGNSKSMEKAGSGFFIEANGALLSRFDKKEVHYDGVSTSTEESTFGAGLGMAIGWKYLSRSNWVGDIFIGGGRDFANDSGYPRLGISIGKRF